MITINTRPRESYTEAVARTLEEQAAGTELEELAFVAARELEKSGAYVPESLHPSAEAAQGLNSVERMSALAQTFPTLVGRPGVAPFDASLLMEQEHAAWTSNASRQALSFVLSVWNVRNPVGQRFNAAFAMAVWDAKHRAAFLAWAKHPWGA